MRKLMIALLSAALLAACESPEEPVGTVIFKEIVLDTGFGRAPDYNVVLLMEDGTRRVYDNRSLYYAAEVGQKVQGDLGGWVTAFRVIE